MTEAASETWLEQDKEIPGQKYVCLSFLSPEKVLKSKDIFFFSKFLDDYQVQYKISASEKFIMDQVMKVTKAISSVEDIITNSNLLTQTTDVSGSQVDAKKWRDDAIQQMTAIRAKLSQNAADDLALYVKQNMREFKESSIQESYENFMFKNRKKLDEEFFTNNEFRTSIRGLKVRGVYDTYAEAAARAKTLQKLDPYFNVFVGQCGFWLPWDPEPHEVADQEYAEDQLNTLMKSYKDNESKKEALYEEQKRERMAGSKVAVPKFGPGSEKETNSLPNDMFRVEGEADLAIARKKELAAAATTLNM